MIHVSNSPVLFRSKGEARRSINFPMGFDYIGGWIGGHPKNRRRRCRECQNALAAEKKPVRAVSAEDVARIRIRLDAE